MIGVFDSGLGGLSVLAAIARALPTADLVYLADNAHLPYGDKEEAFIARRVLAIGEYLAQQGCTLLVVACNTATAAAIDALRSRLPHVPIVGVEPGVKPAAETTETGQIAVLATTATAKSARLAQLIERYAAHLTVHVVPCPGWATHVETLQPATAAFRAEVAHRITPLIDLGVDRIVLGCTHYGFLRPLIAPHLGEKARLIEVSDAIARQVVRLAGNARGHGTLDLLATAHAERLAAALSPLRLGFLLPRLRHCRRIAL
ncbi:MAG: glutamate racemase [Rhodocyclaceae bacterium]|nr:glutamate racemase [Rhodocyclaceae bacterium]